MFSTAILIGSKENSDALIGSLYKNEIEFLKKETWVNKNKIEKHGGLINAWLKAKIILTKHEEDSTKQRKENLSFKCSMEGETI